MVNTTSPVFLLVGEERYLKDKVIFDLRSSLLDNTCGELDYKILYGPDTSADEILDYASTIPFFSSKRLIVVKDFEKLPKEDIGRLLTYIKKPNQYTCLVIDTKDGDILKSSPSLARYAKILKFSDPTGMEISSWITRFVSSKGKAIDEDAVEILKDLQGSDLLNLSQELEKLITFVGSTKEISKDDVESLVGKSIIASAFDIANAVAELDTSRAIAITYDLISSGKRPHEIIGLLAWHFKMMAKRISRARADSPFSSTAAYSFDQIASKLGILLEADLAIKRARYAPRLILEFAIIRLCLK